MKQQVRIIGGRYRGKKLSFPDLNDLRPTTDRVRETLFNWLMHDIHESCCLDAFAGSGALGFEAYSRGAKQVYLIELHTPTYKHLKQQAASFQTQQLHTVHADIQTFLKQVNDHFFDIIFYDPPFSKPELYQDTLQKEILRVLKPNGLLYLESPKIITLDSCQWTSLKQKKAGAVIYALYSKQVSNNSENE